MRKIVLQWKSHLFLFLLCFVLGPGVIWASNSEWKYPEVPTEDSSSVMFSPWVSKMSRSFDNQFIYLIGPHYPLELSLTEEGSLEVSYLEVKDVEEIQPYDGSTFILTSRENGIQKRWVIDGLDFNSRFEYDGTVQVKDGKFDTSNPSSSTCTYSMKDLFYPSFSKSFDYKHHQLLVTINYSEVTKTSYKQILTVYHYNNDEIKRVLEEEQPERKEKGNLLRNPNKTEKKEIQETRQLEDNIINTKWDSTTDDKLFQGQVTTDPSGCFDFAYQISDVESLYDLIPVNETQFFIFYKKSGVNVLKRVEVIFDKSTYSSIVYFLESSKDVTAFDFLCFSFDPTSPGTEDCPFKVYAYGFNGGIKIGYKSLDQAYSYSLSTCGTVNRLKLLGPSSADSKVLTVLVWCSYSSLRKLQVNIGDGSYSLLAEEEITKNYPFQVYVPHNGIIRERMSSSELELVSIQNEGTKTQSITSEELQWLSGVAIDSRSSTLALFNSQSVFFYFDYISNPLTEYFEHVATNPKESLKFVKLLESETRQIIAFDFFISDSKLYFVTLELSDKSSLIINFCISKNFETAVKIDTNICYQMTRDSVTRGSVQLFLDDDEDNPKGYIQILTQNYDLVVIPFNLDDEVKKIQEETASSTSSVLGFSSIPSQKARVELRMVLNSEKMIDVHVYKVSFSETKEEKLFEIPYGFFSSSTFNSNSIPLIQTFDEKVFISSNTEFFFLDISTSSPKKTTVLDQRVGGKGFVLAGDIGKIIGVYQFGTTTATTIVQLSDPDSTSSEFIFELTGSAGTGIESFCGSGYSFYSSSLKKCLNCDWNKLEFPSKTPEECQTCDSSEMTKITSLVEDSFPEYSCIGIDSCFPTSEFKFALEGEKQVDGVSKKVCSEGFIKSVRIEKADCQNAKISVEMMESQKESWKISVNSTNSEVTITNLGMVTFKSAEIQAITFNDLEKETKLIYDLTEEDLRLLKELSGCLECKEDPKTECDPTNGEPPSTTGPNSETNGNQTANSTVIPPSGESIVTPENTQSSTNNSTNGTFPSIDDKLAANSTKETIESEVTNKTTTISSEKTLEITKQMGSIVTISSSANQSNTTSATQKTQNDSEEVAEKIKEVLEPFVMEAMLSVKAAESPDTATFMELYTDQNVKASFTVFSIPTRDSGSSSETQFMKYSSPTTSNSNETGWTHSPVEIDVPTSALINNPQLEGVESVGLKLYELSRTNETSEETYPEFGDASSFVSQIILIEFVDLEREETISLTNITPPIVLKFSFAEDSNVYQSLKDIDETISEENKLAFAQKILLCQAKSQREQEYTETGLFLVSYDLENKTFSCSSSHTTQFISDFYSAGAKTLVYSNFGIGFSKEKIKYVAFVPLKENFGVHFGLVLIVLYTFLIVASIWLDRRRSLTNLKDLQKAVDMEVRKLLKEPPKPESQDDGEILTKNLKKNPERTGKKESPSFSVTVHPISDLIESEVNPGPKRALEGNLSVIQEVTESQASEFPGFQVTLRKSDLTNRRTATERPGLQKDNFSSSLGLHGATPEERQLNNSQSMNGIQVTRANSELQKVPSLEKNNFLRKVGENENDGLVEANSLNININNNFDGFLNKAQPAGHAKEKEQTKWITDSESPQKELEESLDNDQTIDKLIEDNSQRLRKEESSSDVNPRRSGTKIQNKVKLPSFVCQELKVHPNLFELPLIFGWATFSIETEPCSLHQCFPDGV